MYRGDLLSKTFSRCEIEIEILCITIDCSRQFELNTCAGECFKSRPSTHLCLISGEGEGAKNEHFCGM